MLRFMRRTTGSVSPANSTEDELRLRQAQQLLICLFAESNKSALLLCGVVMLFAEWSSCSADC